MSFVLETIGFFLFVGGFMYLVLSGRLADMLGNPGEAERDSGTKLNSIPG